MGERADADDLASVASYAICKAAREWDGRGAFAPYAKQRAVWAMREALRSQGWVPRCRRENILKGRAEPSLWDRPPKSLDIPLGDCPADAGERRALGWEVIADTDTVEGRVLARELRSELRAALQEYPGRPSGRLVLRMIILRGHRPAEVALLLGLSRKEVSDHYAAGIEYLRQRLAHWGP